MKTCATCRWFRLYPSSDNYGQCRVSSTIRDVRQTDGCADHSDELRPFVLAALAAGATEGQAIARAKEALRLLAREEL